MVVRQGMRHSEGFRTGIDLYTPEELAKKDARAARFSITSSSSHLYDPLKDEAEAKKRERAARFGMAYTAVDHSGLEQQDLLEDRKDHGAAIKRRPEAVHLYGVDRMSTKECLQYFGDYGPSGVEWLDDSSCNVMFADADSAKRAIIGMGRPFGPGEAPDLQGLDSSDLKNLPYMWHKGKDFQKLGKTANGQSPVVPLIYRMATVNDKKGLAPTKTSRQLWLNQRKNRQAGTSSKRSLEVDDDGDVVMAGERKERGGSKRTRKRKRRAPYGTEVELMDVEVANDLPAIVVTTLPDEGLDGMDEGPDLREAIKPRSSEMQSSQFRLFSAENAGVDIPAEPLMETEQGLDS